MTKTDHTFMSTQPGNEIDSDLFLIGSGMGFYDIEYINKFDNKFLFLATDGMGQSLDDGYFSLTSSLNPIKTRLFVPCLYTTKESALENPVTAHMPATQFNAIAQVSTQSQKKR